MIHTGTSRRAGDPIYRGGVPNRTGSLTPGSEHDARSLIESPVSSHNCRWRVESGGGGLSSLRGITPSHYDC
jgi:hypothetical protein